AEAPALQDDDIHRSDKMGPLRKWSAIVTGLVKAWYGYRVRRRCGSQRLQDVTCQLDIMRARHATGCQQWMDLPGEPLPLRSRVVEIIQRHLRYRAAMLAFQ